MNPAGIRRTSSSRPVDETGGDDGGRVIRRIDRTRPHRPQRRRIHGEAQGRVRTVHRRHREPSHTRGDKEFKGHGPFVLLEAKLAGANFVVGGATALQANVYMFAEETESDWTTAAGTSEWEIVYNAELGYRITNILTPVICEDSYEDTNKSEDVICPGVGNLVQCFRCVGDTGSDNDAGHATKVSVDFAPCTITVIKDDPYFDS